MYRCPPFNLNDQALIEGARRTGKPAHVAAAIEAAVQGFRYRMQHRGPAPIVNGELVITLCKAKNFFDDYCMRIVLQEICNATGFGIARHSWEAPANQKQPASPDVIFKEERS
jgi:hypothetical protein